MGQTTKGFTYADPVDAVGDFPATSQVQAEELDTHVGRHAAGVVSGLVVGSGGGSTTASVSFPAGRFTTTPVVVTTLMSGIPGAGVTGAAANAWAWASSISPTGCTINYRRGAADTGTVAWHAMEV